MSAQRDDDSPAIAIGIEELLGMAAVNREFSRALFRERSRALAASGVSLTPTETMILDSVDDATLEQMVANVEGGVPNRDRRAFLSRSAAALLVLAGGGIAATASACDGKKNKPPERTRGVRPDRPPKQEVIPADAGAEQPEPAKAADAAPDPLEGAGGFGFPTGDGGSWRIGGGHGEVKDMGAGHGHTTGIGGIRTDRPKRRKRPKKDE